MTSSPDVSHPSTAARNERATDRGAQSGPRSSRESVLLRGESAASATPWRRPLRPAPAAHVPVVELPEDPEPATPYSAVVLTSPDQAVPVPRPVPGAERVGRPVVQPVEPPAYTGPERRRAPGTRLGEVYAEQLQQLREQAQREGWAAGHAAGITAAEQVVAAAERAAEERLAEAQARWERRLASATAAMTAAAARLEDLHAPAAAELRDSVLDAVVQLVQELFGRELAASTAPALDAVRRALTLCPTDSPVVVRLHPDDLAEMAAEDLATVPASVTLVADTSVERAGAVAEAGARRVDAQLGPALARALDALRS